MPTPAPQLRRRPRHVLAACVLALTVCSTVPVSGETELVLVDGRVLSGRDVRREQGHYVLTLDSGDEITLPVEIVANVRLIGKKSEHEEQLERHPGLVESTPQELGGSVPRGPTGLSDRGPQQLAGEPVRSPSPSEQLRVLGEPAEFQEPIVANDWRPTTDWNMDPTTQNNWAPSKWSKDIVENSWQPESAYDPDADVLENGRARWKQGPINPSWTPTDGFAR